MSTSKGNDMYQHDDILLSVVQQLNTDILNNSFSKLLANDNLNYPQYNYIPHVWENKWFNDETIPGYSKGYCVWKNVYNTIQSFLDTYGDVVYSYAQQNDVLQNYLTKPWSTITTFPTAAEKSRWIERYSNVISGYSEVVSSYVKDGIDVNITQQMYDPLFEYGPLCTTSVDNRIQLYVSTIDNNKEQLSNANAWHTLVLSSDDEYKHFIETEISILFSEHVKNYHMDGDLTEKDVNSILLHKSLSNFNIDDIPSQNQLTEHGQFMNSEGFDYITQQAVKEVKIDDYIFYKWFRLWNSGYLEHCGVVKNNKIAEDQLTDISSYVTTIQFDWEISSGLSAPTYDYNETSDVYSDTYKHLYYGDISGNSDTQIIEDFDTHVSTYLPLSSHYTVSITPIQFNPERDMDSLGTFLDISALQSADYPVEAIKNKNSTFVTTEVHHMKNDSFQITRSDTDRLLSNENDIQLYSYYVTGYRVHALSA